MSLSFASETLEHTDNAVVANALQDETHAVAALGKLILGLRGSDTFDASLNAFRSPATHEAGEPSVLLSLTNASSNFLAEAGAENDRSDHVCLKIGKSTVRITREAEMLLLDDGEDSRKVEVLTLGLHPAFLDIDDAGLENIRCFLAAWTTSHHAARKQLIDGGRHATLLQMNASGVQTLRRGVDMAGDSIGTENMAGKGVELWRRVSKEVGEGDGREGMRVGMVGRVCKDHFHSSSSIELIVSGRSN